MTAPPDANPRRTPFATTPTPTPTQTPGAAAATAGGPPSLRFGRLARRTELTSTVVELTIADVAEAIGWLSRNIRDYGGDPDAIVLIGHSAGAQLVSLAGTSTAWIKGRWVSPKQILGVVSLDTDTFNVGEEAADTSPLQERMLAWNAFGTPTEEAAEARWDRMSPALFADPSDPSFLFVTQATKPGRIAANQAMATKLGEDPAAAVVAVPYDHEGINTALGAADDASVETARVSQFVQEAMKEPFH